MATLARNLILAIFAVALVTLVGCRDDARKYATAGEDADAAEQTRDVAADVSQPDDVTEPDVAVDVAVDVADDLPEPDLPPDACQVDGGCVDVPSTEGCGLLVSFEVRGGFCDFVDCFAGVELHEGGYVISRGGRSPDADGLLTAAYAAELEALVDAIDLDTLESGYGPCCNSHFDGSDTYLTFARHDQSPLNVRISDASAPPELMALVDALSLDPARVEWLGAVADPLFTAVPDSETSTCENAEELATVPVDIRLIGPRDQIVSLEEVSLEGPEPAGEFTLSFSGELVYDDMGRVAVPDESGELWGIWSTGFEPGGPGLTVGQQVTVVVQVSQAFAGHFIGIAVFAERGLLFATDTGLTNLAATAGLPFEVTVADVGCDPVDESGCDERLTQGLRFVTDSDDVILRTAEWGGLAAPGYDLVVRNLQSFKTGLCDDLGHYGYVAYAIAGSDVGVCSLEPLDACQASVVRLENCFGWSDHQRYGLGWPSCESDLDVCAAACMDGLICGDLDCEFDPDVDCDGWGPWYECFQECLDPNPPDCITDADCTLVVDCCSQQFVCLPPADGPLDCDIDCDPSEPFPTCACQSGVCVTQTSICEEALNQFASCGHTIDPDMLDYDILAALGERQCDPELECVAECLANPAEDECFQCHWGEIDCFRDPTGECFSACGR